MTKIGYAGYRFPPVIIQQAVWLYARFTLSFRDVEDLLAERSHKGARPALPRPPAMLFPVFPTDPQCGEQTGRTP